MKNTISKIVALAAFGFGSIFLLVPGSAFASNDGWNNVNWNNTHREASGMWYLENWLGGVQQRWSSGCHNNCNNHGNHHHSSSVNYWSNDQRNNVNVHQSQEVVGSFKSVRMEQSVRVYVNGQLTSSDQQLTADHNRNGARQVQDVSVRGY